MPGQLRVLVIVRYGHPAYAWLTQTANGCVGCLMPLQDARPHKRQSTAPQDLKLPAASVHHA